jgi:hypothetical protein
MSHDNPNHQPQDQTVVVRRWDSNGRLGAQIAHIFRPMVSQVDAYGLISIRLCLLFKHYTSIPLSFIETTFRDALGLLLWPVWRDVDCKPYLCDGVLDNDNACRVIL